MAVVRNNINDNYITLESDSERRIQILLNFINHQGDVTIDLIKTTLSYFYFGYNFQNITDSKGEFFDSITDNENEILTYPLAENLALRYKKSELLPVTLYHIINGKNENSKIIDETNGINCFSFYFTDSPIKPKYYFSIDIASKAEFNYEEEKLKENIKNLPEGLKEATKLKNYCFQLISDIYNKDYNKLKKLIQLFIIDKIEKEITIDENYLLVQIQLVQLESIKPRSELDFLIFYHCIIQIFLNRNQGYLFHNIKKCKQCGKFFYSRRKFKEDENTFCCKACNNTYNYDRRKEKKQATTPECDSSATP